MRVNQVSWEGNGCSVRWLTQWCIWVAVDIEQDQLRSTGFQTTQIGIVLWRWHCNCRLQMTSEIGIHSRQPHIFPWEKLLQKHIMCFQYVFPEEKWKFLSRKNLIKMNHFIHIFLLWKIVYFTEKKICEKWYIFH